MMRDQVERLLRLGWSDRAISRHVGINTRRVAPIRQELGLPRHPPGRAPAPSLAEAWRAHTQATGDGHLAWRGDINDGQPRVSWKGRRYSAYRIAFRIRTGRDPQGYAKPICGRDLCVWPAHVDDTPGRRRTDDTYTAIFGRTP